MSDISFNEDQPLVPRSTVSQGSKSSSMVRLVLSTGIAKTEQQANYLLIGIAALLILGAGWIFFGTSGPEVKPLPKGSVIITAPGQPPRLAEPLLRAR